MTAMPFAPLSDRTAGRPPRVGLLFDFDWDRRAHDALAPHRRADRAGFGLFSFPSQLGLFRFDLDRFAQRQAARARRRRWAGVLSHHEQFGALAAALTAQAAGLPGTSPQAIVACQHKLHTRRVLQAVCPEANLAFQVLPMRYGGEVPAGLPYPSFVKPVKAAFSVLARRVGSATELHRHTRFGPHERWIIAQLVEPFDRVARRLLPEAGTAHAMLMEEPMQAPQYNLDGFVVDGELQVLGYTDALMYPGTMAFMRFQSPSRLPAAVRARAEDVARRFLHAVGFCHGAFNMEFFHDPASDRLAVIEFNPRLASQFGDLYRRTLGRDAHAMALALATGHDDLSAVARAEPVDGVAASVVFRCFDAADAPPPPSPARRRALRQAFPDAMVFAFPKAGRALARDFKWLGSHRYGIVHLGAPHAAAMEQRIADVSSLLGWPNPADVLVHAAAPARQDAPLVHVPSGLGD